MVVTVDIKNLNPSRTSVFSGGNVGGGKAKGPGGGVLEDVDHYVSLSFKARLIGFGICLLLGAFIIGMSYISITTVNLRLFVVFFSLGNVIAICSTMFLMGPINQLKRMFDPVRLIATLIFLISIGLTIYFGYFRRNLGLAIIFGIIEIFALFWYSISYIPYARALICKAIGLG